MKNLRIPTIVLTAVISLMNLPIGFDPGDLNAGIAWAITVLGVCGLLAAAAMMRRVSWGPAVVVAVAIANVIGAGFAMADDLEGAEIGLAISVVLVVVSAAYFAFTRRENANAM